jgi:hypothetical protein
MKKLSLIIALFLSSSISADQATSGIASIEPENVIAGTEGQSFTYTLTFSGGTADFVTILNPFPELYITVTGITIDGNNISLLNQETRPSNNDVVSWYYDNDNSNVNILTNTSLISSSIEIQFIQTIPGPISLDNQYPASYDDAADIAIQDDADNTETFLTINPSDLNAIFIESAIDGTGNPLNNLSLTTDNEIAMHSIGRDQYNNYLRPVISNWSTSDNIGVMTTLSGSSTIFTATTIGTGVVQADSSVFEDETGIITVSGGSLSSLQIRDEGNGGGSSIGDVSLTTDETLTMYAAGYDADGNYLGDQDVSWSVTGTLDAVTNSGSSITFSPSTSSTSGTIVVSSGGVTGDATGTITIISPPLLQYVVNSLQPDITYAGLDTSFTLTLSNIGDKFVTLDTLTTFSFTDGEETYISYLNNFTTMNELSNELLTFKNNSIPLLINPGLYTPKVNAVGLDEDGNEFYQNNIEIGINELSIEGLVINSIFCSNEDTWAGQDSIIVTVTVTNQASQTITDLEVNIIFSNYESQFTQTRTDDIVAISSNQQETFSFTISIGEDVPPGPILLDASIDGMIGDLGLFEIGAANTDSINILSFPNLIHENNSFMPQQIMQGMDVSFSIELQNAGSMGLVLNDSTFISFANNSDTVICNLVENVIINGATSNNLLSFDVQNIPVSFNAQEYEPFLSLYGEMNNGTHYKEDISIQELLLVYNSINITVLEETLSPDTVIQGQNTIFSIQFETNTPLGIRFNQDQTKLLLSIDGDSFAVKLTTDTLISVGDEQILEFESLPLPLETEIGTYELGFTFSGLTEPFSFPFVLNESEEIAEFTVIGPPNISYEYGLEPKNVVVGEGVEFKLFVKNNGMADVELTNQTLLYFSDGLSSFYTNLKNPTLIPSNSVNQLLVFNETQIPESFNFGNYFSYSNISGVTTTGAPYEELNTPLDTIKVESGKGPSIINLRYIDGGFSNIPDGLINENDLIKIKFDEPLNFTIVDNKNALDYFVLLSDGDQFGFQDSSVVISPDQAAYSGLDKDSCLFIQLGFDPILATNSSSNREGNILKYIDSPSLIIISPAIKQNLIEGISLSDAGYLTNQPFLDIQFNQIDAKDKDQDYFGKYSLVVDDFEDPVLLNFFPDGDLHIGTPYSALKGFVSGRNFMYYNDLLQIISNYSLQEMDIVELKESPSLYFPNYLKSIKTFSNEEQIMNLVNEFDSYKMTEKEDGGEIIINPLKQMYTNIIDPIEFTYNMNVDIPDVFDQPLNTQLVFNNMFDNFVIEDSSSINNNFEIINQDSLYNGIQAWFKLNTILERNNKILFKTLSIDISNKFISNDGYFIWSGPNPYKENENDNMVIEYELNNRPSSVGVVIVDGVGNIVKEWNSLTIPKNKGKNRIPNGWDGRNGSNVKVSPGPYVLLLYVNKIIEKTWVFVVI